MNGYLIQRANFADNDGRKGIDSILSLDYMGSSEFEWGALPESLNRIRTCLTYTFCDFTINDKTVTIFCKVEDRPEISSYLKSLAANEFNLKEFSAFDIWINDKKNLLHFDFWWDIGNDLMFWRKDINFEKKFKKLI